MYELFERLCSNRSVINHHLYRYCQKLDIEFTRGRPYKKDDNAHVEQKNWTHVRKIVGWDRFDTPAAISLLNDLYRNELRLMMNLFQPSVKLLRKERVGARLKRVYDSPLTPLDRLRSCRGANRAKVAELVRLRRTIDPFVLAQASQLVFASSIMLKSSFHYSSRLPILFASLVRLS